MDYSKHINKTISGVKPSGIRKFFDIAVEMDNVISLSIGEPDFKTPWHIRQAGIESLERGKTFYTPNRGLFELRKEISNYYFRRFNLSYIPETEVLVTVGGSEGIDLAFRTLVNRGDEVLIPQPAFVCYEPLAEMAGGVPVIIETKEENNFRLTKEELEAAITDKTTNRAFRRDLRRAYIWRQGARFSRFDRRYERTHGYCQRLFKGLRYDRLETGIYPRPCRDIDSDHKTPPVWYNVLSYNRSVRGYRGYEERR